MLTAAFCMVAISACTKVEPENELPYITFGVSGIGESAKALISDGDFTSNTVYVYGVMNNTTTIYDNVAITKEQNSYNWSPATKRQWQGSANYSFHGYTHSGSCNVTHDGLKISLSQPDTYVEENMVDYMLSHSYKVANGSNHHIVMLYMQHAMACVEISVVKQMSDHNITLKGITLEHIYTNASMECTSHAIANSGDNNVWETKLSGNNEVRYTDTSFTADGNTLGKMTLLAVPQQLTSYTQLSVEYTVDEDNDNTTPPTEYSQAFKLYNYTPYVWESGHKIKYTLTINTGVDLKAQITDWTDGGYTEGVILPN